MQQQQSKGIFLPSEVVGTACRVTLPYVDEVVRMLSSLGARTRDVQGKDGARAGVPGMGEGCRDVSYMDLRVKEATQKGSGSYRVGLIAHTEHSQDT